MPAHKFIFKHINLHQKPLSNPNRFSRICHQSKDLLLNHAPFSLSIFILCKYKYLNARFTHISATDFLSPLFIQLLHTFAFFFFLLSPATVYRFKEMMTRLRCEMLQWSEVYKAAHQKTPLFSNSIFSSLHWLCFIHFVLRSPSFCFCPPFMYLHRHVASSWRCIVFHNGCRATPRPEPETADDRQSFPWLIFFFFKKKDVYLVTVITNNATPYRGVTVESI